MTLKQCAIVCLTYTCTIKLINHPCNHTATYTSDIFYHSHNGKAEYWKAQSKSCFEYTCNSTTNNSHCKVKTTVEVECRKPIKGKNPTNLKQHLSTCHGEHYKTFLEKEKEIKKSNGASSSMDTDTATLISLFNKIKTAQSVELLLLESY